MPHEHLSEARVQRGDPSAQVEVDAGLLWRAVLADLQASVPTNAFEWLRHTRLAGFAADVATVEAADRVTADTLSRRFNREIERALSERVGRPIRATFQTDDREKTEVDLFADVKAGRAAAAPRRFVRARNQEPPYSNQNPESPRQMTLG
jgi:chromosomal replication initiation ATPase DnaA